ncbi:MAG: M48 family metallopeptidase [Fuscovulum sp.]|nr:M48 family metallopeptidase [Fuscovulum sp.]
MPSRPASLACLASLAVLALTGCVTPPPAAAPPASAFVAVAARVEPVAEEVCRSLRPRPPVCNLTIAIDDRPDLPPNAFQTVDALGRPYVVFTPSLIAMARNADELAFVLGHEAAHHIAGHIPKRQEMALSGAILAGAMAGAAGLSRDEVRAAQAAGAEIGARQFSQEFELEADSLGAQIAWIAGFDPVRGAAFFDRLPDPGQTFLASHPPNALRKTVVADTVAQLRAACPDC